MKLLLLEKPYSSMINAKENRWNISFRGIEAQLKIKY